MSGIIGKNVNRSSGVIGTEAVSSDLVNDTSPQLGGFLDANGNYIQMEKGGDISSASPTVIDTDGDYFDVTGTTNFSAFTVAADRHFFVQFDGALTMTHHATNLDLPGGANITTAAGDVAEFVSTGANTVQCVNYTKADGTAVVAAGGFTPGASVYRNSGTQTITTGTVTEVVWQAETYDTDGDFASNGFTVGTGDDGIYIAVAQVYWNSPVIDVEYQIDIAVDGTDVVETMIQMPMSTNQTTDVVGILSLAAAEKVTITIYHDVGSNDTIGNGLRLCQFSIQRIA